MPRDGGAAAGDWLRRCGAASEGKAATVDLEGLERSLTVLEEKLYAALTAAAPEDLLVGLKEHAALELAPYRSRMGAVQMRQVEQQFERSNCWCTTTCRG